MPTLIVRTRQQLVQIPFKTKDAVDVAYEEMSAQMHTPMVEIQSDWTEDRRPRHTFRAVAIESFAIDYGDVPEWVIDQAVETQLANARGQAKAQVAAQNMIVPARPRVIT